MLFIVKENKMLYPGNIRLLGTIAVMFESWFITYWPGNRNLFIIFVDLTKFVMMKAKSTQFYKI
ncbi:hypothetical protein SAMN05421755_104418 [Nitrosomonas sp. Nm33]|nr:hypothetical protein SAMN05421755_104418 [Nitrosomonas sp. Nm33]